MKPPTIRDLAESSHRLEQLSDLAPYFRGRAIDSLLNLCIPLSIIIGALFLHRWSGSLWFLTAIPIPLIWLAFSMDRLVLDIRLWHGLRRLRRLVRKLDGE